MAHSEQESMEKEVVTKEDGRTLIYYHFGGDKSPAAAQAAESNNEAQS